MNELSVFNPFFDDAFGFDFPQIVSTRSVAMPKVDVKETSAAYTLDMDLPGRTEKDVDIDVKDNMLTIASRKEQQEQKEEKNGGYVIRERRMYSFSRRFQLPDDIEQDKISATFKNGVLEVVLPRHAAPSPKKIAITAA